MFYLIQIKSVLYSNMLLELSYTHIIKVPLFLSLKLQAALKKSHARESRLNNSG